MAYITLKEYAQRVGRARETVYAKYKAGKFKSAEKRGRDIWIDENEPYVDNRIKTGRYIDWRYGYKYQKQLKERKKQNPAEDE